MAAEVTTTSATDVRRKRRREKEDRHCCLFEDPPSSSSSSWLFFFPLLVVCCCCCGLALLRVLVGYQPHSGQDDWHGAGGGGGSSGGGTAAATKHTATTTSNTGPPRFFLYGGDYEAQRHWMELTLNLPNGPSDWYWYDLEYWGLDYPPLSAYQSYICGWLSHHLVGPETMALFTSRGYEDATLKAFLRATVLVLDMVVYGSAVWAILSCYETKTTTTTNLLFLWRFCLAMSQPAMLLVDHGHFQYNTTALGLALWSLYYCSRCTSTKSSGRGGTTIASWSTRHAVLGSIFFCLALNFKQMTLYYAPAIFAYLLGRCWSLDSDSTITMDEDVKRNQRRVSFFKRFVILGVTVIACFIVLWWPIVAQPPNPPQHYPNDNNINISSTVMDDGSTLLKRIKHVLHRILPFQRGLFQAKVSNLWCALSVKPFRFKQRVPSHLQPLIATIVTLILILPACIKLFNVGASTTRRRIKGNKSDDDDYRMDNEHLQSLLWGTTSTALAFFLASFQVHEKSLLIALAPATLLLSLTSPPPSSSSSSTPAATTISQQQDNDDDSNDQRICRQFPHWFAIVTTWTLWPLIVLDRLRVAYVATLVIFMTLLRLQHLWEMSASSPSTAWVTTTTTATLSWPSLLWTVASRSSYVVMIALHVTEIVISPPPPSLPDLFPVLWTIVGCAFCCFAWLVTCWHLWFEQQERHQQGTHDKAMKRD